jgi:beta-galactosidase
MTTSLLLGPSLVAGVLAQAPELRWDLGGPTEVTNTANLAGALVGGGGLEGYSRWDPYVYFRLPEGGVEADAYRTLQVRLYSSAPADLLDIYYKTAAGYWCLGGSLPIKAGWGVYTTDLAANAWRETEWPEARKWGGPDGRIVTLRFDPGNQAERWVAVDWVRLTGEPLPTGYDPDPRLTAATVAVQAPSARVAGEALPVTITVSLPEGVPPTRVTAYARLQTSTEVLARAKTALEVGGGTTEVALELPTLPFLSVEADLCAGLQEAIGIDESERPVARVAVAGPEGDSRGFSRCEVKTLGGSPAVHLDGTPIPLICFGGDSPLQELDATRTPRHVEIGRQGIRIMSDWFGTSGAGALGHVSADRYDYSSFDLYFARMAQRIPGVLFLPHVYVTPSTWWQQAHPEEMVRFESGEPFLQSFASERWRQEIGDDLLRLIEHLRAQPYADRILGLIICSGYTAEWQTWGVWQDEFTDFSDPGLRAWREWLRRRYRSDAGLREAWSQEGVTLAEAVPPSGEQRKSASRLLLRDPQAEAPVIDYLTFLNQLDAEAILHFARIAKEASDRRLLVGTYYGYLTQHHYHQAESGHCALSDVLRSPDIDFLMSPPTYSDRAPGEVSGFMSAVDSVHRHGKIWLSEADYRTHLTDPAAGYGRCATVEESVDVLWREFAHVLCKRAGVSWYDMEMGWLSGPDIPPELGRMQRVADEYLPERKPSWAEVAVFIDPPSFYYLRPDQRLLLYVTLQPMLNLYRAGAPFDLYLLDDLRDADFPPYRMYVFLNAYALDAAMRTAIQRHTDRPGVATLWHTAPGYCFPDERRLATVQEMGRTIGVSLEERPEEEPLRIAKRGGADRYAERVADLEERLNPALPIGPIFVPQEGEVLLRLEPGDLAGLAKAGSAEQPVFYSVLPCLPPTVLRRIYLDAGVHVYNDADDCLYADSGWIGLHSAAAGACTLHLPTGEELLSARDGRDQAGQEIALDMPARHTELLRRQ